MAVGGVRVLGRGARGRGLGAAGRGRRLVWCVGRVRVLGGRGGVDVSRSGCWLGVTDGDWWDSVTRGRRARSGGFCLVASAIALGDAEDGNTDVPIVSMLVVLHDVRA